MFVNESGRNEHSVDFPNIREVEMALYGMRQVQVLTLSLEKWSNHVCRRVLFLIFLRRRFQGSGQGKKQTIEYQ
jgi:hypothetical protein